MHCAEPGTELPCDLSPGPTQCAELPHPTGIHKPTRALDPLALGTSDGNARAHTLANQFSLELGD